MNPGYAGRTELPDNLKSMFRPISMMVPDSGIIAENILFSDGFQNTKVLAKKVLFFLKTSDIFLLIVFPSGFHFISISHSTIK